MTTADDTCDARVAGSELYFNAILHPYRSMGSKGFFWIIVFCAVVMAAVSIPFFLLGAWPIVGFAGLDILLIYWAFRCNFADARAMEQIKITYDTVSLTQTSPKGQRRQVCFNPYWVRLKSTSEEDKGMTQLFLTSHGRTEEIGAFLHASERESLAQALNKALRDAKATKTISAQVSGG